MKCSKFINIDWLIRKQEPSLVLSKLKFKEKLAKKRTRKKKKKPDALTIM